MPWKLISFFLFSLHNFSFFLCAHRCCHRRCRQNLCCYARCTNRSVPPEYPLVLNRWGHQLNGTVLGPMEEGDDIVLTCRVTGGKPRNSIVSLQPFLSFFLFYPFQNQNTCVFRTHIDTHPTAIAVNSIFSAVLFFVLHLSSFFVPFLWANSLRYGCSVSFFPPPFFSMYFHSSCSGHVFLFFFSHCPHVCASVCWQCLMPFIRFIGESIHWLHSFRSIVRILQNTLAPARALHSDSLLVPRTHHNIHFKKEWNCVQTKVKRSSLTTNGTPNKAIEWRRTKDKEFERIIGRWKIREHIQTAGTHFHERQMWLAHTMENASNRMNATKLLWIRISHTRRELWCNLDYERRIGPMNAIKNSAMHRNQYMRSIRASSSKKSDFKSILQCALLTCS